MQQQIFLVLLFKFFGNNFVIRIYLKYIKTQCFSPVGSDDGHEELLAAANAVTNPGSYSHLVTF